MLHTAPPTSTTNGVPSSGVPIDPVAASASISPRVGSPPIGVPSISSHIPSTSAPSPALASAMISASLAFSAQARPSPTSVLTANPAAKTKSQPRPTITNNPTIKHNNSNTTPAATASNASFNSTNAAAAAPFKPVIYSPPKPLPSTSSQSPAPSTLSSTPSSLPSASSHSVGPVPTVVASSTNANVSITKAPPPTFDTLKCEECGPTAEVIVDPHQGVEVCTSCGLVIGNFISDESEWRTFSDRRGDDPNRVGGPEIGLLADAGLATLMGDSPHGLGSNLAKLQNKSAMSANHRQLLDAFRKSSRIGSMLSLPQSTIDRANELYKKILESKAIRPRGSDTLIVTCIFMVCKSERVPRTIKEMCGVSEVAPKELGKCFKEIKRLGFHKTLNRFGSQSISAGGASSDADEENDEYKSYVSRWGNQIRLPARLITAAKAIAEKARDVLHTARDPGSTCGAAIYIASQFGSLEDRRSMQLITQVVNISAGSIRTVIQEILDHRANILPAEYVTAKIDL